MASITQAEHVAWQSGTQKNLRLEFSDGTILTNSSIVSESMTLEQTIADQSSLFGNVYASSFKVQVFDSGDRYAGLTVNVSMSVEYDGETYTRNIGEFYVLSDKLTADGISRNLECYDMLYVVLTNNYTSWYESLTFPMTLKSFRDSFFNEIGITQKSVTLQNDSMSISKKNVSTLSGSAIIGNILSLNTVWGYIDNDGNFDYVSPKNTVDYTIADNSYVQGSFAFEEYETSAYSSVTISQTITETIEDESGSYEQEVEQSVTVGDNSGSAIFFQNNLFTYGKTDTELTTIANNILSRIDDLSFTPSVVSFPPYMGLELGDVFSITTSKKVVRFPVLDRRLSGITALRDTFTAEGVEYASENANSTESQLSYALSSTNVIAGMAKTAQQLAGEAQASADDAKEAAETAWNWADDAHDAAETAWNHADDAANAASAAQTSAGQAQASAIQANASANNALTQLSTIEDVFNVLNWIAEHGTYALTTDTSVVPGKYYFTRSGTSPNYSYTVVTNPTGNPQTKGYYELTGVDEAVTNYISSHLALTDQGLWVIKDNQGYKVLLANDGLKIYDNQGHLVSTFGESIVFDSSRPQTIGNNSTYIKWYDSDNDQVADKIEISGDVTLTNSVTIGGMPTKVSDLTNDSGFQTASDVSNAVTTGVSGKADKTAAIGNVTTKDQYYLSTSSSSATGGSWGDSVPTWSSGKYIWTRVATTKTPVSGSATTTYSTAVYDSALTTALSTANTANTLASAAATKTDAIKATVSVYYRKTTTGAPSKPTSSTTIGTSASTDNAWEYVMPQPKKGCYFYTCERYTFADDSVNFSAVRSIDNATYTSKWCNETDNTYIDGGAIYANSVTADKIAAHSITVGKMDEDAQSQVLNSNIQIGGRNLLLDTNAPSLTKVASEANRYWSSNSTLASDGTATFVSISDPPSKGITYGIKLDCTTSGTRWHGLAFYNTPNTAKMTFEAGKTYTQSVYIRVASGTANQCQITSQDQTSYGVTAYQFTPTAEWQRYSRTFTPTSTGTQKVVYFEMRYQNIGSVEMCGFQIEEGNKATTWTPAPEDVDADISDAAKTATNYITADSSGIKVHASGTSGTDYVGITSNSLKMYSGGNELVTMNSTGALVLGLAAGNHVQLTGTGMHLAGKNSAGTATVNRMTLSSSGITMRNDSGTVTATIGDTITLGTVAANKYNTLIDSAGMKIRKNTTVLASYGDTVVLGKSDSEDDRYITLAPNSTYGSEFSFKQMLNNSTNNSLYDYSILNMYGKVVFGSNNDIYAQSYIDMLGNSVISTVLNGDANKPYLKLGQEDDPESTRSASVLVYGLNFDIDVTNCNLDATNFKINNRKYGYNDVLWTGGIYMTATHTANLSRTVSAQPHGIVLAWSAYVSGAAKDYDWIYYFIPKWQVANANGTGVAIPMCTTDASTSAEGTGNGTKWGCKYVKVYNDKIVGYNGNNKGNSGYWVLRKVIGV